MTTAIHRRVEACRAGTDPTLIARMPSGWAVLGDPAGARRLLPAAAGSGGAAPERDAAGRPGRGSWRDLARLGQAVLELTGALRINYAMFGNLEPALHAHVLPRYADEPEALRTAHPWAYDWSEARRFDPVRDGPLLRALRARLGG